MHTTAVGAHGHTKHTHLRAIDPGAPSPLCQTAQCVQHGLLGGRLRASEVSI